MAASRKTPVPRNAASTGRAKVVTKSQFVAGSASAAAKERRQPSVSVPADVTPKASCSPAKPDANESLQATVTLDRKLRSKVRPWNEYGTLTISVNTRLDSIRILLLCPVTH